MPSSEVRPRSLLVLKDGHVGSEWFAETITRQPGTKFLFEMGSCTVGSLAGKRAFYGPERHACACSKDDCAAFRGDRFASAPCLGAPSRTTCRVLGGSHMTMGAESEVLQWQDLVNGTDTVIVLQTRSNLVKWAWSFYRTGAMKRLRREPVSASKESIHRREGVEDDRSRSTRMHVDPIALLRMIVAKQARSERLLKTARRLARLTTNRREYVLLYETMQDNLEGEMERLYTSLRVPFDAKAHRRVPPGSSPLLKHAPEDLSMVISNWQSLLQAFAPYPCLKEMLVDTKRHIFDDCGSGNGGRSPDSGADPRAPCSCSWRTPIVDVNGTALNDAYLAALMGAPPPLKRVAKIATANDHSDALGAAASNEATETRKTPDSTWYGGMIGREGTTYVIKFTEEQLLTAVMFAILAIALCLLRNVRGRGSVRS